MLLRSVAVGDGTHFESHFLLLPVAVSHEQDFSYEEDATSRLSTIDAEKLQSVIFSGWQSGSLCPNYS